MSDREFAAFMFAVGAIVGVSVFVFVMFLLSGGFDG